MYENLIGESTGFHKMEYSWRDVILYALGVGAGKDDLDYIYEKRLKAIPTFGTLPCYNSITAEPKSPTTYPAVFIVRDYLQKQTGTAFNCMHMSADFHYYRPIDPIKGTLVYEEQIKNIYDWGDRGIVIETTLPVYDEAGNLICETVSQNVCQGGGNYGGDAMPKNKVILPTDREADINVTSYMSPVQHAIYRLSGDTHPAHIDPETARRYGAEDAFMQGLCSYGYACRLAVETLADGEPKRLTRLSAQMRAIVYPDTEVAFMAWKEDSGKALFRLIDTKTGHAVLDRGIVEWK